MNYYLPTTLKLLDSYYTLSQQGVQGENIMSAMHNIRAIMHTIVQAFEKQLDSCLGKKPWIFLPTSPCWKICSSRKAWLGSKCQKPVNNEDRF